MEKKRIVSGITATGSLTLGNYLGAIKNFVQLQEKFDMYIFVADLHALTIDLDPQVLKTNKRNIMALYVAAGLDPQKTTLFYQSDVEAHAQMSWLMENMTTIGELSRMTQFKDKGRTKKTNNETKIKTGLLTYPTLMAGDILLYNPQLVPVGQDQKQHIELTRNIAQRFNNKYGSTFIIPQVWNVKIGAKIMSLTEPTKKMSKSSNVDRSHILLLEDPNQAERKILKAITDSENKVYLSDAKPGVKNLLTIYAALKDLSLEETVALFKNHDYKYLKTQLGHEVKTFLIDLQKKYHNALQKIDDIARKGALKARQISNQQLKITQTKMGL